MTEYIVYIVAKTKMRNGICIGAITEVGKSVRLEPSVPANKEYNVGDIWEITTEPATKIEPPHVEDIVVHKKARIRTITPKNLETVIERFMPPTIGDLHDLFEGLLQQTTKGGSLYLSRRGRVPSYSTAFWCPDRPLTFYTYTDDRGKSRDRYRTEHGSSLPFVGFQNPLETLPAGTLLRVSLARWWHQDRNAPDIEKRCWLQLSGWFL